MDNKELIKSLKLKLKRHEDNRSWFNKEFLRLDKERIDWQAKFCNANNESVRLRDQFATVKRAIEIIEEEAQ